MDIREKIAWILSDDLITCGLTHENPPPHKDCGEECGVSIEDQIVAVNPFISPIRSGGQKHKKCMDCWNEYVSKLTDQILAIIKEADQSLPERKPPYNLDNRDDVLRSIGYAEAQQDMFQAGWRKVEVKDES